MRFDSYSYDAVAPLYDELAELYSLGRIRQTKEFQLESIAKGDRVLYAGVGRGADALRAVRLGARVTAIDLSPRMLARFAGSLAREGLEAERIEGDVAFHRPASDYDAVVANYFLNLFDVPRAQAMIRQLASFVRPGGLLMLADFAPASGGGVARALTSAYYRPLNALAWALGFCALHSILDYARLLEPLGFRIRSERRFPVLPGLNPAYVSIVAERVA